MSAVTALSNCKHDLKTETPSSTVYRSSNLRRSMESLYAVSSTKFSTLNRRKCNQRNRDRNPSLIPAVSDVKQRVISARMLRMKQLQNQIGEAQHRVSELTNENRILKSLHKRQDTALSKYEGTSAELPQLLHSHSEEVRVWQTRCRNLQRQNKELISKLKTKDTIILSVTDQNKHLLQLNKDKNLEEREKLAERVKDLEERLLDKDGDMKLLARRLQLEAKSYRTNLNIEQQKYRDLISKIEMSEYMIRSSDVGDRKSKTQIKRGKSPSRSLASKSTSSLDIVKDHQQGSMILPPCEGHDAKKTEVLFQKTTPRVNNKVKLLPETYSDNDEVNLSKKGNNKTEKFLKNGNHNSDDEITVRINNGMNRTKIPPKKSSKIPKKLSPLPPKQDTNKSSDDSEFSDEDYQLFSKHNGTKMVTTLSPFMAHNSRDLLDHKMHLNELESKMKHNSLDAVPKHPPTASSSTSSLSDHHQVPIAAFDNIPAQSYNDRGDIAFIQREMRDSMMRRESQLDEYCDTLVDGKSTFSSSRASSTTITPFKKLELASQPPVISNHQTQAKNHAHNHSKSNGNVISNGNPSTLDSKKKNVLLAALKHIDNNSYEA